MLLKSFNFYYKNNNINKFFFNFYKFSILNNSIHKLVKDQFLIISSRLILLIINNRERQYEYIFAQIYLLSIIIIESDYPPRRTYIISAFPDRTLHVHSAHNRDTYASKVAYPISPWRII